MRCRGFPLLLLGLQLLPAPTFAAAIRGKGKRWTQGSTFVISDWQQPEAAAGDGWEPHWDARVREMAAANFTVLMGSMSSGRLPTPTLNKTTIQARRGQHVIPTDSVDCGARPRSLHKYTSDST